MHNRDQMEMDRNTQCSQYTPAFFFFTAYVKTLSNVANSDASPLIPDFHLLQK